MKIAVIGDYASPGYKDLLLKVKIAFPEEEVMDLSRHDQTVWAKQLNARFTDISAASLVIIGKDWTRSFDAKRDITHAQSLHKDCLIEREEAFRPFPEYAESI